jgi:uncharacterized protein (TIGR02300 family)
VAKAEWGVKRLCQGCGAKFYDFLKDPSTCPSCGKKFDPEALRARRSRSSVAKAAKPAAAAKKAEAKSDKADTESETKDLATDEPDDENDTVADSGDDEVRLPIPGDGEISVPRVAGNQIVDVRHRGDTNR